MFTPPLPVSVTILVIFIFTIYNHMGDLHTTEAMEQIIFVLFKDRYKLPY